MSNPTTSSFWNQTTPAVPTGDQACVIQSDGVTPQDSRTVYPKTATNTLRGVVKPDTSTITVDGSGNLSAKPMGASGASHAAGIVPDPGSTAGTTKFLREDASWAAVASPLALQHDGAANGSQSVLNLKHGAGIVISDDGTGGVTIASSGASVSYAQNSGTGSTGTTITGTLATSVTPGSAIIVALFAGSFTTSISGVTDNHGNTYTLVKSIYPASTYCGQYVYAALNVVGGATTVTATYTQANNQMNMIVAEYIGVVSASAVDATASTDNGTVATPCTIGPITTSAPGDILVSTFAFYHALQSASSGFTTRASFVGVTDANLIGYLADAQATSAGSYSVTWTGTWGGGNSNAGILIALKATGTYSFAQISGSAAASQLPALGASGPSHAAGIAPDPGSTVGTAKFLREDATWAVPPSASGLSNPMTAVGDLIIGGTVTSGVAAPATLPAGTSGYVLTSNGSSAAPSWQAASGGGGGGLFGVTPPTKSGAGLTTAWNQAGTFAATDTTGGIFIFDSAGTGTSDRHEGIVKAYPGAAYTVTALFSVNLFASTSNGGPLGLVILNTLTTQLQTFGLRERSSSLTLSVDSWTSPSAYSATPYSVTFSLPMYYIWLRIKDNGTSVIFSYSFDGNYWVALGTMTKSGSFLGSSGFNYLGVGLDAYQAPSSGVGATVLSWQLTTP